MSDKRIQILIDGEEAFSSDAVSSYALEVDISGAMSMQAQCRDIPRKGIEGYTGSAINGLIDEVTP